MPSFQRFDDSFTLGMSTFRVAEAKVMARAISTSRKRPDTPQIGAGHTRCGNTWTVRRTSPGATVVLGAILSVGALLGATAIVVWAHPGTTGRVVIVAVAFAVAIVGGVMMLKDLTP